MGFANLSQTGVERSSPRIETLIHAIEAAALSLNLDSNKVEALETGLRKTSVMSRKLGFPEPVGVSLALSAEGGFIVGVGGGVELLILLQQDGKLGIGVYPYVYGTGGAEASIKSAGVGGDLVFNLDSLDDYDGAAIGGVAEFDDVLGASVDFSMGAGEEDIEDIEQIASSAVHLHGKAFEDAILSMVTESRCINLAAEIDVGVGADVGAYLSWSFNAWTESVPATETGLKQAVQDAKFQVMNLKSRATKEVSSIFDDLESNVSQYF